MPCINVSNANGKTNQPGRKELMGSIRHRDTVLCSHGALAQYLFQRFHINGEAEPDFSSHEGWYDILALVTTAASEAQTKGKLSAKRTAGEELEKPSGKNRS